jgi:hypothetical protein
MSLISRKGLLAITVVLDGAMFSIGCPVSAKELVERNAHSRLKISARICGFFT